MDIIELTRQLGAALQQDERYCAFKAAQKANEEDDALNELIGKLQLLQLEIHKRHSHSLHSGRGSRDLRAAYSRSRLQLRLRRL